MDTLASIGKILSGNEQRDAVHIAILPVIAGQILNHGDPVKVINGKAFFAGKDAIGIVDPFLAEPYVREGQWFWIFMKPGTITGLRHEWTHPTITAESREIESEAWLRKFAQHWNMDYDDLVRAATATTYEDFDEFALARGIDLHDASELGEDHDLFWYHLEQLMGNRFDSGHRERFGWSCSC